MKQQIHEQFTGRKALLMFYDWCVLLASCFFILILSPSSNNRLNPANSVLYIALFTLSVGVPRLVTKVYQQVWRYSRVHSYIRLIFSDFIAIPVYLALITLVMSFVPGVQGITFVRSLCVIMLGTLGTIIIRCCYTWVYEQGSQGRLQQPVLKKAVELVMRTSFDSVQDVRPGAKIRIAIVGAGRIGAMLAEELLNNPAAAYTPVCFLDVSHDKIGRSILDIPVYAENEHTKDILDELLVQEIVCTMQMSVEKRRALYDQYKSMGYTVKAYSFPIGSSDENSKRQIREFDVEELLFRQQVDFLGEDAKRFYQDKTILISGGGGSIGSELARQIARVRPRQLIILDIYENNAYDIQQELKLKYGDELNLAVEIASVRDREQLDKVFRSYRPEIVFHAAAHKHVPLMEHNCSEAVKNNVFGTLNIVDVSEKYGVSKFIMISTDKAVNPTNVMGASKRMCEMIVLSRAARSRTSFSCTRFGNVLGSNGSVIPLFKRQIMNGGPITLTDRRVIRYFMTIPEASQLVLSSGAMAQSGELFVLDMGRPVKILDLAETMIRLTGLEPYKDIDIVETGLRPGEKLFEELLIKSETLKKTDNDMIFIEHDEPLSRDDVEEKLALLQEALQTEDDDAIRLAMKKVVPTFHSPRHVNRDALADGRYEREADGRGQAVAG